MAITLRRATVEGFLTYSEIQAEIQDLIDDDDSEVLVVIRHAIKLTYNRILSRYRGKTKVPRWLKDYDGSLTTTADARTTTIATNDKPVERILKVSVQDSDSWFECDPISVQDLEESPNWWKTNISQRPTRFLHQKTYSASGGETNVISWFYLPDEAYLIRYWFELRINQLSNDDDVPILPDWSQAALIYGSLVHLAMFDIRVKVGPWEELYRDIITNLDAFSNNFVTNEQDYKGWGV